MPRFTADDFVVYAVTILLFTPFYVILMPLFIFRFDAAPLLDACYMIPRRRCRSFSLIILLSDLMIMPLSSLLLPHCRCSTFSRASLRFRAIAFAIHYTHATCRYAIGLSQHHAIAIASTLLCHDAAFSLLMLYAADDADIPAVSIFSIRRHAMLRC